MNNKRVKLKDIAERAGISINSVSRALKNGSNISETTKKKVKEIANEMGYVPDIHAQSLRGDNLKVIAIVYDNIINPYYPIMIRLINKILIKNGYEAMIFVDHHALGHLSDVLVKNIVSYRVAGIITFLAPTLEASKMIKNNKIPIVLIGRDGSEVGISSIYSDDYSGGKIAAQELINKGGKNFAYITEHEELEINNLRLSGFKDELESQGFSLNNERIVIARLQNAEDLFEKVIEKDKTIDSIFCFSDLIAFQVIQRLNKLKISVPDDINIVGFDNLATYFPYPFKLSSVDGDKNEIVHAALKIIFNQIKNGYSSKVITKKIKAVINEGNTLKQK